MSDQIPSHQPTEISPESCWERASHVMSFPSGDECALHDMEMDEYFVLSGPVASFIWDLCDGVTPASTVLDRITADFEIDPETAWADLQELLGMLHSQGLIVRL